MGRPRKGYVTYVAATAGQPVGHYCARLTLADGSRPRLHFDPEPESSAALERARARAAKLAHQLQRHGIGMARRPTHPEDNPDSDARWWERFFAHRDELEMAPTRGRFKKYIEPILAELGATIWSLTPKDCETIRNHLDAQVSLGRCAADTAVHVWHILTAACGAASGQWRFDRHGTLKVRETNPTTRVFPPESGEPKELQWLYPDEFLKLVSCEAVPLLDRRRYALVTYLFCRAGEFALLDFTSGDIDLDHGVISIRRAWNRERKIKKLTKTGGRGSRRFSIEPALLPLLRAMHRESGGQGKLCPFLGDLNHWAERLREHLKLAGITRPELFTTDATRKQLRFHDLRATGLTWLAVRKESPIAIHVRAGHTQWKTTEKYVRVAETVGLESVGELFPALPLSLLRSPRREEEQSPASGLLLSQKSKIRSVASSEKRTLSEAPKSPVSVDVPPSPIKSGADHTGQEEGRITILRTGSD